MPSRETAARVYRRLLATPLAVRIAALTGLVLIVAGYALILARRLCRVPDVQLVTQYALGGMALVICGALVELVLVVVMSRR